MKKKIVKGIEKVKCDIGKKFKWTDLDNSICQIAYSKGRNEVVCFFETSETTIHNHKFVKALVINKYFRSNIDKIKIYKENFEDYNFKVLKADSLL